MTKSDEIKRLRAKVERLNDEADYLATVLVLITSRSDSFTPQEAATLLNMVKKDYGCISVRDWRNAARLAVVKLERNEI